jgi:sugar-phosphatase
MKAAIFDMDGLLIDSEPLWKAAEIEVFGALGVPLTPELCRQTTGVRLDGVVRHWFAQYPWRGPSHAEVESRVLEAVGRRIAEEGSLMLGVEATIETLLAARYELAVASSSPLGLMQAALTKLGIIDVFSVLHSAEEEAAGKPDPAVYLTTLRRLGVAAQRCIAFEDSVLGVQAAKAAGIAVVAVPDPAEASNPGFAEADLVLGSLTEFSLEQVST